jgi:hypothetical protein
MGCGCQGLDSENLTFFLLCGTLAFCEATIKIPTDEIRDAEIQFLAIVGAAKQPVTITVAVFVLGGT